MVKHKPELYLEGMLHAVINTRKNIVDFLQHPVAVDTKKMLIIQFFTIVISFGTTAILSRSLEPDVFGEYQLMVAWMATAAIFGLPGFNTVVLKSALKHSDSFFWFALRRSLCSALVGVIICTLVGVGLILYFGHITSEATYAFLISASIPVSSLQNYDSFLMGKKRYHASRVLLLMGALVTLLSTGVASYFTDRFEIIFGSFVFSRLTVVLLGLHFVRGLVNPTAISEDIKHSLLRQGWRQNGLAIISVVAARIDRLTLGALDPVSLSMFYIGTLIPFHIKNNAKTALNIIVTRWGSKSQKDNISALSHHKGKLFLLGIAAAGSAALSVYLLVPILFGANYTDAIYSGLLFSCGLIPIFWNYAVGMESQMQTNGKFNQVSTVSKNVLFIGTLLLFGSNGLIWVTTINVASEFYLAILSYCYFYQVKRRYSER